MRFDEEKHDELIFFAEEEETADAGDEFAFEPESEIGEIKHENWKLLVVDDEEDIHTVTHLTLDDFEFEKKPVEILDAYSAQEAYELLDEQPDIAIMLLDVVMETTSAGLDLVRRIRSELHNHFVRIILRTGQPGHAPERKVVVQYDINDYKAKTELTADKIFTLVTSGLRAYRSLIMLEGYRRDLQVKVDEAVNEIRQKDHIIIKQSRQNTVSELISNIAHQWRQPLNTVMALIQTIEYEEDLSYEFVHEQTSKAMEVIQGMSETIDDLRFFFEPVEERERFRVSEVIAKCIKLLSPGFEQASISLEVEILDDVEIEGYQNDYAQAVLQIINNSRDALLRQSNEDKWIRIAICEKDGRSHVTISDNGGGISEDIFDSIFEPYVT